MPTWSTLRWVERHLWVGLHPLAVGTHHFQGELRRLPPAADSLMRGMHAAGHMF